MITPQIIEEVKKRLIKTYKPLEIYLFGSYAWGTPTEESDLDLLVVVKKVTGNRHNFHILGYHALSGMMLSKDLLILTKDEFEQKANHPSTLSHKIKNAGKKIYAKA